MNLARTIAVFAISALLAVAARAQSNRPSQTFDTSAGAVKVTPIYHATMLIEAGGKNIYVDPAKPANFSGLPKADLILITDIHGDHMDPEAIAAISKSGTQIFAPPPWSQRSLPPPLFPTAKPNHGPAGRLKRSPCTT